MSNGINDIKVPQKLWVSCVSPASSRISVPEIAYRLGIGRLSVYEMLEQGKLPGVRLGRRWIVTRHAFGQWERTCGMGLQTGLTVGHEVTSD